MPFCAIPLEKHAFVQYIALFLVIIITNLYICTKKSIMMHYEGLIRTIKERREMMLVTQESLAELSGVSLRTLKQFERGKGNPTLSTLHKLTDVLGLEISLSVKDVVTN
jgi:DNA-binding XRE family transcriptional regulator